MLGDLLLVLPFDGQPLPLLGEDFPFPFVIDGKTLGLVVGPSAKSSSKLLELALFDLPSNAKYPIVDPKATIAPQRNRYVSGFLVFVDFNLTFGVCKSFNIFISFFSISFHSHNVEYKQFQFLF